MRIQSRFKDYYDYASPYRDTDERSYYWVRERVADTRDPYSFPKIVQTDKDRPSDGLPRGDNVDSSEQPGRWKWRARGTRYVQMFVTLGDKTVSFYRDQMAVEKNTEEQAKAAAEFREINMEWEVYSTHPGFKHRKWTDRDWRTRTEEKKSTEPVVIETNQYPGLVHLQMEHKTPLIMMTDFGNSAHPRQTELVINPRLVDYGIQHVFEDALQVYQELEMWFTDGKFDVDPVGNPEQTNIEKVVSHGFDKVKSFRKMPRD